MASPAVNPPPPSVAGPMSKFSASMVNSFRVAAVLERLSLHVVFDDPAGPQHPNGVEYYNLLLSLARGIDYAVANNDVPDKIQRMPDLIKEICRRKSDACSQSLVMVLLISVKNACKVGWFPEKEKQELLSLINDFGSSFYNPRDIKSGTSDSLFAISTVFTRFYPQLRMGEILTSLEVKPGYWALVNDFQISKNTTHDPQDKIRLFMVQTDNIETSACLINPPKGNLLINGKGVDRRIYDFVDPGPQMPTNVTTMLKYGTNLLQVVGDFPGHYVVVIAFVRIMTSPLEPSGLQDHISSTISAPDPDSDLIEGPSRISLNCPISRSRIQVPVKGQSCKHPQCFDFSNFVGINLRRPSWRCAHCNQSVSYIDLRIDQNIAKVLKEVGSDISEVMISNDGSWKAVMESEDNPDSTINKISNFSKEVPERQDPTEPPPIGNRLDLTGDDDQMDDVNIEDQDRKPLPNLKNTSVVNPDLVQPEDNFWSGVYEMATTSTTGFDPQVNGDGAFEPTMLSNLTSPALTDSISPALNNQEVHAFGSTNSLPIVQSQLSAANNFQLQQSQLVNSVPSNEFGYGKRHSVPVNVSRTPVAVQALPAHRQAPNTPQRPNNSVSPIIRNSSSTASPVILPQTQQQFPRSLPTSPASFHQNTILQGRPHSPAQLGQQAPNRSATPAQQQQPIQRQGLPRTSTGYFTGFQNTHLQKAFNNTMLPPPTSQSPSTPRHPLTRPQSPLVQTPSTSGAMHSRMQIPSQQASPSHRQHVAPQIGISRPPGVRAPSPSEEQRRNSASGGQPSPRGDGSGDPAPEQNWRPTGRMRGSLTGRPFTDEISQLVIQPTRPSGPLAPSNPVNPGSLTGRPFTDEISQLVIQPTQPTRPSGPLAPSNPVNPSLSAPPHLRASMPNSKNTSTGNTQNMQ